MFKKKYTKWIPLGEYEFAGTQCLVMVRGNKKTGELYFKTKIVNKSPLFRASHPIGKLPIDVKEQWILITKLMNEN